MTLKRAVTALVIGAVLLTAAASTDARSGFRFTLRDTAGAVHDEREWANAKAVVLFFITPDCPINQGYVPEINRIAQEYGGRGVRAYAVQSDLTAAPADVRRHVAEYGYRLPVLDDPAQRLVVHTGAEITPEAVVLSPDGRVLYRGRIDDRIVSLGTRRPQATQHDLRNALDAVLSGRAVARAKTTAFGCIIPRPS